MMKKGSKFDVLEKVLWAPENIYNKEQTISEIELLNPVVEFVEQGNTKEVERWTLLRRLMTLKPAKILTCKGVKNGLNPQIGRG